MDFVVNISRRRLLDFMFQRAIISLCDTNDTFDDARFDSWKFLLGIDRRLYIEDNCKYFYNLTHSRDTTEIDGCKAVHVDDMKKIRFKFEGSPEYCGNGFDFEALLIEEMENIKQQVSNMLSTTKGQMIIFTNEDE